MAAACVAIAVAIGGVAIARYAPKPPLASYLASSTAIYDAEGRLLRLALAADDRRRLWVPLARVSPQLVEAVLLKEDRHFYWHPGVGPFALARAAFRTATGTGPKQGGSTITMQLALLLHRLQTRTVTGKVVQIVRALQLELRYSKREILEAYLNVTPYGSNIEGVAAASLIYFGKRAERLSLSEALTLAVIPQAPARRGLAPDTTANLIAARARLFGLWTERHPEAHESAGLLKLPLNLRTANNLPFLAPHATAMLIAKNASAGPARDSEIHSTLDLKLQRVLERQIQRYVSQAHRFGIRNAAAMLVDFRSMETKAMVGSADFADSSIDGQVNGALAKRSPGSALKPFIYALAIDQGLIHPRSVLKDAQTAFGPFSPENFDGGFVGPVTATDALVRSRNIPAVALAARLNKPSLYDLLRNAGVSRMASETHYGLALALGGGEVTMEETVVLYAMLANRGVLRPLRYRASDQSPVVTRLLSEEASFMTLEMLHENPRPDGVFSGARAGVRAAWKTGTSWGFRDAWPPFDPRFIRVEVFEFWPSDIQRLFAKAGMPRRKPPAIECGRETSPGMPPTITSPLRGAEYEMRADRLAEEAVPLTANAGGEVRTLYWFVNDAFVGDSHPGNALAWKPGRAGKFLVRAVDEQGRSDVRELRVAITR